MARESIAGPDSGPEPPFPIRVNGRIVKGFGRGSKELGIPTANIPISGLDVGGHTNIDNGVYFGWAGVSLKGSIDDATKAAEPPGGEGQNHDREDHAETLTAPVPTSTSNTSTGKDLGAVLYPAVLSIGFNPYYNNEVRSVEIHLIQKFDQDFYNAMLNLSILGFIRLERNYDSMQELIDDINFDIEVAKNSLERKAYGEEKNDPYLNLDYSERAMTSEVEYLNGDKTRPPSEACEYDVGGNSYGSDATSLGIVL